MSNKIEELRKDIDELELLAQQATRQKSKDLISIEIHKLNSELRTLEQAESEKQSTPTTSSTSINKKYEVKLNNYAWDQTNKFVKFYITLKNVHSVPAENVKCTFTPKSLELTIKDLDNKDYVLKISHLLYAIDPEQSNWKVKTDMVIVSAAKKVLQNWSHVTEWEKKSSDAQKFSDPSTENMDPSEGLMSLMKNMYEKGDDELKRTIAKAWTESQGKGPAF